MGDRRDIFGTRSPRRPMPRITDKRVLLGLRGAPGRIRTCDLRIRSPLLYPAELRGPRGTREGPARSGRPDSNRRPFGPKPNALPGCATPRLRGSMARREDGDIEQALGAALRDSSPRGAGDRGGPWGPCSLALATASLPCSRSWPSRLRPRRGPTAARRARARAASDRCAGADAMPGQAAAEDLAQATLCLMNAERTARGLGRLQAEPLLEPRGVELRAPDGPRAVLRPHLARRVDDARAHQGDELPARRDVVVGGREPRVGHRQHWPRRARWSAPGCSRPSHRANLLDRHFADVGIGVAAGAPVALEPGELGGTYMTDFGRRLKG